MRAGTETATNYRCEAASVAGFIQQLAVGYVARGYRFYVTGCIPHTKNLGAVDLKLISRYGIDCSKWVRCRRKERGLANVQYLRYRLFFVILATPGGHQFFSEETRIHDIRQTPIQCFGYSVGCYRGTDENWHPSVRINAAEFKLLREQFLALALSRNVDVVARKLQGMGFSPFAPVRNQYRQLLRAINKKRRLQSLEPVGKEVLPNRRRIVSPFG